VVVAGRCPAAEGDTGLLGTTPRLTGIRLMRIARLGFGSVEQHDQAGYPSRGAQDSTHDQPHPGLLDALVDNPLPNPELVIGRISHEHTDDRWTARSARAEEAHGRGDESQSEKQENSAAMVRAPATFTPGA
jgi:hypothetical protein